MDSKQLKAEAEELDRQAGMVPLPAQGSLDQFKKCYSLQYKAYRRMLRAYDVLESEQKEVMKSEKLSV